MIQESVLFDRVVDVALRQGCRFAYKNETWWMRWLGRILFFNPRFMDHYTTTIGRTIYFPSPEAVRQNPLSYAIVVGHELQHVLDSRQLGPINYALQYLGPQWLALLTPLLFLVTAPWWIASLPLLFLLPFGSEGRAALEFRGYGMTLAQMIWLGDPMPEPLPSVVGQFTSMAYFRMCPNKNTVEQALTKFCEEARTGPTILEAGALLRPVYQNWLAGQ